MSFISIITINYNNASGLEKTIKSVINQTTGDYELIVIDGGSTDESVNIINKNTSFIKISVSEKDKGIYDAQNKGISLAKGKYLIFMNSGDCFTDDKVLENTIDFIKKNDDYKIYYGNTNLIEKDGKIEALNPPEFIDLYFFYTATINHQSCFIHKSLFESYGYYNLNYKICSDYEFLLKVFVKEPEVFKYININICNYENYGMSKDLQLFQKVVDERNLIKLNLLDNEQLIAGKRHEIKLLGRKSRYFKFISNFKSIYYLYDKFYFNWYQMKTK